MKKLSNLLLHVFLMFAISSCASIGEKIKNHLEQVGSELTGTAVTVEEVAVRPARGAGAINGLRVHNPSGYIAKSALNFETLHFNIGLVSTIAGEPLVVEKLLFSYPVMNLEQKEQGGSNLRDILANAKANIEKAERKSAEIEPASKDEPDKPLKIKIKELAIEGVTLNVRRADGTVHSAILPSIHLENVGGDEGISPAQLGLVVVGSMTGEVLKQAVAREIIERAGNIKQALSAENLMAVINYKLQLTPQAENLIRPVVDELSTALTAVIDAWVDQGYIDLAELSSQLRPLFETFKNRVEEFLASEQFALLEERVLEIQENAIEVLRYLAINKIAEKLDMTPEEMADLRPILHEYGARISNLIKEIAADPHNFDKAKLTAAYQEVAEGLKTRLSDWLNDEQMQKYMVWQEELLERILFLIEKYS